MVKNKIEILSKTVDDCSKKQLHDLFAPITELPHSSTKAEMISHCLNKELGAYGFSSFVSPDKSIVLIDDSTMSYVMDFFENKSSQPYITNEQVERIRTIQQVANDNKVDLLWAQSGWKKGYYFFKQYGFNGANLYNVLNVNAANYAMTSIYGYSLLSMSGLIALSWSGSLFFSTLENYIPNTMPRTKTLVSGTKFALAIPVRCAEWTTNNIFGVVETAIIKTPLPTNTTEVFKLNKGPKLKDIWKLKKPVLEWLISKLEKFK